MPRRQTAGQNKNLMTANKSFEKVGRFHVFLRSAKDQNYIDAIKSMLNL
jgi:hypothetical protein